MHMLKALMVAGATLTASPAFAATVVTTTQFGPAPTDYSATGPGLRSLNLFDSSLGTLTSVLIEATYGFTSAITVLNTAQSASRGTVRTESAVTFSSGNAGIGTVFDSYLNLLGAVNVGGMMVDPAALDIISGSRSYTLAAGQSTQVTAISAFGSTDSGIITDSTALAAFAANGGGSFLAGITSGTGTLIGNTGGNTTASQQTTATGTLRITYNYTAVVPEPATWAMMLVGFGMIGTTARYRRRKLIVRC